jgi:sensor histidine kinase YesM
MNWNIKYYFLKLLAPELWVLRHLFFWSYWYSTFVLQAIGVETIDPGDTLFPSLGDVVSDFAFVYINFFLLIPFLLKKKKILAYTIACFLLISIYMAFNYWYFYTTEDRANISLFLATFIEFIKAFEYYLQVTALRFIVEYFYNYEKILEKEKQKLQMELAYLKSQINPHFLFNTLNNIATLSEIAPERVTPTVIELSNVLRYQLYESEKESVFLSNEIDNLQQNLNLEAMRLNEAAVTLNVEGNPTGIMVAPLIFLPFIENALKHSADPSGISTIDILFEIKEKNIIFTSKNSKPSFKTKQLAGGLGLKNIKRRLEILYPEKHELKIEENEKEYKVRLSIERE